MADFSEENWDEFREVNKYLENQYIHETDSDCIAIHIKVLPIFC